MSEVVFERAAVKVAELVGVFSVAMELAVSVEVAFVDLGGACEGHLS